MTISPEQVAEIEAIGGVIDCRVSTHDATTLKEIASRMVGFGEYFGPSITRLLTIADKIEFTIAEGNRT